MNFYIPQEKRHHYESAYEAIKGVIKYQMGWTVSSRRIESLIYTSNRRKMTAKVGELGRVEHQHEVAAILEGPLYIVVTRSKHGLPGPMILVDTKDVLEIHDFTLKAKKPVQSLTPA